LVHFGIGVLGSGIVVFTSYVGLKGYERLPEKIYTGRLLVAYTLFGGAIVAVLQNLTPDSYLPMLLRLAKSYLTVS